MSDYVCDREGCDLDYPNHYHCGRCTSAKVTSMMGHYIEGEYRCKPEDVPSTTPRSIRELADGNRIMVDDRTNATWVEPPELAENMVGKMVKVDVELDDLPDGAVIVGVGDKWENEHSSTDPVVWQKRGSWWMSPSYHENMTSTQVADAQFLPARYAVVWVPPADGTDDRHVVR